MSDHSTFHSNYRNWKHNIDLLSPLLGEVLNAEFKWQKLEKYLKE